MDLKDRIDSIVARHALAAQSAQHDRSVSITAIASARRVIEGTTPEPNPETYRTELLAALVALQSNYHDPDGQYTNGKGVLGSLIGDIAAIVSDEASD